MGRVRLQLIADERIDAETAYADAFEKGVLAHRENLLSLAIGSFGEAIDARCGGTWIPAVAGSTLHIAEIFGSWNEYRLATKFLGLTVLLRQQGGELPADEELQRTGRLARELRTALGFAQFDLVLAEGSELQLEASREIIASLGPHPFQASIR